MWPNPQEPADLVTFIEDIHNGKLHFLCSEIYNIQHKVDMKLLNYEIINYEIIKYTTPKWASCYANFYTK